MSEIETRSWFDPTKDCLLIRILIQEHTSDITYKRGIIFKVSSDDLKNLPAMAEGQPYIHSKNYDILEYVGEERYSVAQDDIGGVRNDGRDISICCNVPTKAVFGNIRVCTKCGR